MRPWLLSKCNSTDARPIALRSPAPLKMTSCIDSPRSAEALDSPSTQRTASITLDLPQPLGPTMPTSWPGVAMVVGSTNDLKPASLIWVRRKAGNREGVLGSRPTDGGVLGRSPRIIADPRIRRRAQARLRAAAAGPPPPRDRRLLRARRLRPLEAWGLPGDIDRRRTGSACGTCSPAAGRAGW